MRRIILGLSVLLLLGGCRCESPPGQELASNAVSPAGADVVVDVLDSEENCGVDPEVRRARRAAQVAREAEEARIRSLQVAAAAQDAASTEAIQALRTRNQACAERSARKDPACVAFVEGTARVCTEASGDAADNCAIMGQLGGALRSQEVGRCAGFSERGFRVICEGAITGEFACRKRGGGAMGRACRALAQGDSAAVCAGEDLDAGACNVVHLITAIRAGISREGPDACASVTGASSRRLCAGWYRGVEECKAPRGSRAPECRSILLDPLPGSAEAPGEWTLRFINLFSESASCTVEVLSMMPGEGGEISLATVDLGVLQGGGGLKHKVISLPPERIGTLQVRATCAWESP